MSTTYKIRMAAAWAIGITFGLALGWYQYTGTKHVNDLFDHGQKTLAGISQAKVTSKYDSSFREAEADYAFMASDGKIYTGKDSIDITLVDAATNPQDNTTLKNDAAVEVVYLPEDPSINRNSANIKHRVEADYMLTLVCALFVAGGVWVGLRRVLEFFGKD